MWKRYSSKWGFYRSIDDLPVWNWNEIHKTSDLKYLIRTDDYGKVKGSWVFNDLYDNILQEYVKDIGFGDFFEKQFNIKKKLGLACAKFLRTRKINDLTWVNIYQAELDELKPPKGMDFTDGIAILEQNLGKNDIDPKKVSVRKYNSLLKLNNKLAANGSKNSKPTRNNPKG